MAQDITSTYANSRCSLANAGVLLLCLRYQNRGYLASGMARFSFEQFHHKEQYCRCYMGTYAEMCPGTSVCGGHLVPGVLLEGPMCMLGWLARVV